MIAAKLIPVGFLSVGIFLLMQVILPIASFEIWQWQKRSEGSLLVSPTSPKERGVLGVSIGGVSVKNSNNFPAFFSTLQRETQARFAEFTLTVPKLKLGQEVVFVDSNDLTQGLVHLPGSALPGEKGNVFISGHSALSPLFSFKKAPFSSLTDLKKGDEIVVEAAGIKFRYQVVELTVVDPQDLSVINAPETVGRYITLMTCVPPGLNYKRLVVLGKMI